jgi:hypothetical protein
VTETDAMAASPPTLNAAESVLCGSVKSAKGNTVIVLAIPFLVQD